MTDGVILYHNPRCSKSRASLELLGEQGVEPKIIKYLDTPLDPRSIKKLLKLLGLSDPRALMRTHETEYKDNNLADESLTVDQLIQAIVDYPKLMERPIVVNNGQAAIGRPPENILAIL
ncbi:MAG: arsenate reductase (glutaredoxin) [Thiotrichaceae bacterium]|nr:arsenate reductase (glutaredoxin) [Thiotrichaceae bacterium]